MAEKITEYAERRELGHDQDAEAGCLREAGELPAEAEREEPCAPPFPEPWDRFRDELEARLSCQPQEKLERLHLDAYGEDETVPAVFVSRAPGHGVSGAGHKEIIRSGKKPGYTVTRTELKNLKLDRKTGEIAGYYNRESDTLLYSALKERLAAFHGDAGKAFEEPFYKPKADGSPGSRVRKVKTGERIPLGVDTGRGLAGCGRMVRPDVFHVRDDGCYHVPICAADTVKRDLPDRAVLHGQPYENWKVMRGEDFLFSLYPDDVVCIRKKNGIRLHLERKADSGSDAAEELILTEGYFYYEWFNIGTGALRISTPDRSYAQNGLGGKRPDLPEKHTADVPGSLHRVSLPEKRMAFRRDP